MKRVIFLSFILGLCLLTSVPQVMAQKQSRMEKLLRYLNNNDAAKWQKGRDKLDSETQSYYTSELALLDVLNQLWNEQNEQAATDYFGCYQKASQGYLPTICDEEKIELPALRNKAEQSVLYLIEGSKNKIPLSQAVMDSIRSTEYPADSMTLQRLQEIRELALLENMIQAPSPGIYQMYVAEYPDGKFLTQINAAENKRLYQLVKSTPSAENFKAFFENPGMVKFFQGKDTRPFLAEARALYDNFLYQSIDSLHKDSSATAIRQVIDEYKKSPYLTDAARTHLDDVEYLSEKVDFELLKPAIVNSESLKLLKNFLSTHKYKEFRDKANELRAPYVLQAIVTTPNSVKYYNQGRLIKEVEKDSTGNVSTTYTYNDKGQLTSMLTLTEKNNKISNEVQTNRLYDPQGRCIFEVKMNPRTKTDIYRQTRRFGADGSIESDSLKYTDGRYVVNTYNKQGLLTEAKEYSRNGELQAYTNNKYDDKGRITESQHQNLVLDNTPDRLLSKKESYKYDKYGYLTRIDYQWISGNNQQTARCMTLLYDDYGNRIDGNSYYEYDNTGQWIYRADRDDPQDIERVQLIYK